MLLKFILSVFVAAVFSLLGGGIVESFTGLNGFAVSGVLFLGGFVPRSGVGMLKMSLIPEVWADYIVSNLFKNNDFILNSIDESQYCNKGIVHIPNAGAPSKVKRNRPNLPASVTRRNDIDVLYPLDEFTTDPRLITNAESVQLSYDKMESVMSEDMSYMRQFVADCMIYNWRPTFFMPTTGEPVKSPVGLGERRGVSLNDFTKIKEQFNMWSIPHEDRAVLIETKMLSGLIAELKANQNRDFSIMYDAKTGTIDKIESFKIYERESVCYLKEVGGWKVYYDENAGYIKKWKDNLIHTPEDLQDIYDEETNTKFYDYATPCALFYQKNSVARAVGETLSFDEKGSPYYYGDVISFLQRAGGRCRRADGKGLVGLFMAMD